MMTKAHGHSVGDKTFITVDGETMFVYKYEGDKVEAVGVIGRIPVENFISIIDTVQKNLGREDLEVYSESGTLFIGIGEEE